MTNAENKFNSPQKKKVIPVIVFRVLAFVVMAIFLAFCALIIIDSVKSTKYLNSIEDELLSRPLPEGSIIVETSSIAGNLIGNGNKMNYLATALVRSSLSYQQIKDFYYSDYWKEGIDLSGFELSVKSLYGLRKNYGVNELVVFVTRPVNGEFNEPDFYENHTLTYDMLSGESDKDYYIIFMYDTQQASLDISGH